ncbi:MAG TPA: SpvB/TcaC N-terminal domain-containing protein, partial [Parafilimonas sp.]|nr:SpvB/TcaC N-terminal domain-containing protein [Parafilimonas sp.]
MNFPSDHIKEDQSYSANSQTKNRESKSDAIQIPSITLPKGGGALKNIDEKFQVNQSNGTASFSAPLPFSKTRNDFAPALSLNYNSGSGNGIFGLGWSCDVPFIQRKTDKQLPKYNDADESDVFLFSGEEDLVPALKKDNGGNWIVNEFTAASGELVKRYKPRSESNFTRIERITLANSKTFYWRITTAKNIVTIFGRSGSAQITNPTDTTKIFKWLPELSFDDRGNCFEYEYVQENFLNVSKSLHEQNRLNNFSPVSNTYLKRIKYGNTNPYSRNEATAYNPPALANAGYMFETVFDFGDHDESTPTPTVDKGWLCRIEPFSDFHAGFEIRTYRLCKRILFFHYFKELNDGNVAAPHLVRSIDLNYQLFQNAAATAQQKRNAETDFIIALRQSGYIKKQDGSYSKKSLPPFEFSYQQLNWNTTVQNITKENLANDPVGLTTGYQWTDLYSEGVSGILTEQANAWFYKSNLGEGNFSAAIPVIPKPSFIGLENGALQLQDLEADGRKFIV